ncbi:MFS transporter [Desertihabitans brevis]|uniref:MFS transporter n=1 Tax=Desertihabitans brevis TaxID=2268447 RepID=A0A367YV31_9ACTN|nr:MFS transporter [Desertihabitans brevis]RCK69733.1 MFS transporter [Desertihabitans brevis]
MSGPTRTPTSRLAMPVIVLSVFVVPLAISGMGVLLPSIARDLGASPFLLQSVVNGFNAAFAVFTLVWGVLSDRLGYRTTVVIGLLFFTVGSLVSTTAPDLVVLDIGRILSGIGGAAVFTGSASLMSNAWEGAARARNFAIFGTIIGIGSAIGPVVAGLLTGWFGWRGVFVAFGIVTVLALVFRRSLPTITHEPEPGRKVVDFGVLRNPHFLALSLVPVATSVGVITLGTYLPVAFGAIYGLSAPAAGVFMLFMMVPIVVAPLAASRAIHRFTAVTPMKVIYVALLAMVVGDGALLVVSPGVPIWWAVPGMVLIGAAFGMTIGLVDGEALAQVPPHRSGAAAGVLNFVRVGSEAVVIAAFAAVVAWLVLGSLGDRAIADATAAGIPGHGDAYAAAFRTVLLVIIGTNVVLTGIVAALHRARLRRDGDTSDMAPSREIAATRR